MSRSPGDSNIYYWIIVDIIGWLIGGFLALAIIGYFLGD